MSTSLDPCGRFASLGCILLVGIRVGVNRTGRLILGQAGQENRTKNSRLPDKECTDLLCSRHSFCRGSFSFDISYWSFLFAFHFLNPLCNIFAFVSFLVLIACTFRKQPDVSRMLCRHRINFWTLTVITVLVTGKYRFHFTH